MGFDQDLGRLRTMLVEFRTHRARTDLHTAALVWPEDIDRFPVYGGGSNFYVLWEPARLAAFNVLRNDAVLLRGVDYTITSMRGGVTKFDLTTPLGGDVLRTWGQMRTDRAHADVSTSGWGSTEVGGQMTPDVSATGWGSTDADGTRHAFGTARASGRPRMIAATGTRNGFGSASASGSGSTSTSGQNG